MFIAALFFRFVSCLLSISVLWLAAGSENREEFWWVSKKAEEFGCVNMVAAGGQMADWWWLLEYRKKVRGEEVQI